MKYKIEKEQIVYDDFFKIKKASLRHDTFKGGESKLLDRQCFVRGDSVAILLFEKDTNSLLFTNQFRYPTIEFGKGWIEEIVAGSLEENGDAEARVKAEVEEEIGYEIKKLEHISSFFVSPGGTSERVLLYYAEVNLEDKKTEGGGLKYEGEDIQLIKVKKGELLSKLKSNYFKDAKSIIAIQWFLLNKIK